MAGQEEWIIAMKVSIITTVYKAEKDLPRLLDSMAVQKSSELEFFLIDNGSPDRCAEICREYVKKDIRFTLYTLEENIGYIRARNLGIQICDADYIGFCDSDDYLEPCGYDKAIEILKNVDCDLYIGAYNTVEAGQKIKTTPPYEEGLYLNDKIENDIIPQMFGRLPGKPVLHGFAWKQIFKRDVFLNNNLFYMPELQPIEDQILNIDFARACKKIYVDSTVIYNYVVNAESITAKLISDFNPETEWERISCFYREKKERFIFDMDREACSNQIADFVYSYFLNLGKQKQYSITAQTEKAKKYIDRGLVDEVMNHTSASESRTEKFYRWALKNRHYCLLINTMRTAVQLRRK